MTYCIGMLTEHGLVMLADTRTNAGVDNISTFRKLAVWELPGDRVIALAAAGNLSISQTAMNLIEEGAYTRALLNMVLSVLLCVSAAWLGVKIGRQI